MKQTLQEYIEGRLACGSVVLGAIAILAGIILIPVQIKKFVAGLDTTGFALLSIGLFALSMVVAVTIYFKTIQGNANKRMGIATLIGAVPQIIMTIAFFISDATRAQAMAWLPIAFALLQCVLGIAVVCTKEKK